LRKAWVTSVYVARCCGLVGGGSGRGRRLAFGWPKSRAFTSRKSASEGICFPTSLIFFRPHSYDRIKSLLDEARGQKEHDFVVSGFHEGWMCSIYGLALHVP
jgi:hypothetical protein